MTDAAGNATHSEFSARQSADTPDQCIWCDLPVAPRADRQPQYCCYGCQLAHTLAEEKGDVGQLRWTVIRLGLAIFFTMNLMAFTMAMWSLDVYDVEQEPFQQALFAVFRWLSMILAMPVLLLLGLPMVTSAFRDQHTSTFFADVLIVLGVAAAALTSAVNVVRGDGPIYFEVGAMVLVMVTLGRWLEAEGKFKATATLDEFARLLPAEAQRVDHPDQSIEADVALPSDTIQPGDLLRVRSGERFPVDGTIVVGEAAVDEQIFTGESAPVFRGHDDPVLAGTVNVDGLLVIRSESTFQGGSFGRLVELLRQARSQQGRYQRIAESIARWFLPAVVTIALATLGWHAPDSITAAIHNSLSVLLIACPCALGLATPLAVWTAFSTAVRHQVLFRNGEAIERLASISSLCLDKTGTLTTGQPTVSQFSCFGDDPAEARKLCLELARSSGHPMSTALATFLMSRQDADRLPTTGSAPRSVSPNDSAGPSAAQPGSPVGPGSAELSRSQFSAGSCRSVPGRGVEAALPDGRMARLGRPDFVAPDTAQAHSRIQHALATAESVVAFGIDGQIQAVATVEESHRPDTVAMLQEFRCLDIAPHLLTGDREERAIPFVESLTRASASDSGDMHRGDIHTSESLFASVHSGLSPDDKVRQLEVIRRENGTTAMLGDGINDAPVLAVADVGIAMGCGSDIARDSASVCLLGDQLCRVPWAVRLARRTRRTIRQNLFWAFGYNSVGICLAVAGFLNPALAAALMIVSSLLVISNSLRLLGFAASDSDLPEPQELLDDDRDNSSHSTGETESAGHLDGLENSAISERTPAAQQPRQVGAGNAPFESGKMPSS